MKKILYFLLIVLSFNSFALSSFWLGFGNSTHNFLTAQNDTSGGTKKFEFGPTVLMGTTLPFFISDYYFTPAVGYSRFFTKDGTSRSDIILQYHLSQLISSNFLFQFGLSNTISKYGGDGGTITLNNGNSTAVFYQPKTTKTSYTASIDLGAEFVFTSEMSARIQISIDRFLSSDRRRVSNLLTLIYFL